MCHVIKIAKHVIHCLLNVIVVVLSNICMINNVGVIVLIILGKLNNLHVHLVMEVFSIILYKYNKNITFLNYIYIYLT